MTTEEILEATAELSNEQREILITLLQKRQIEIRRDQIAQHAQSAMIACQEGLLITENSEALVRRLQLSVYQEE